MVFFFTSLCCVLFSDIVSLAGSEDLPQGLGFGQGEYYPYVYYKINIDLIGTTSTVTN
jgi:hypothetical protein